MKTSLTHLPENKQQELRWAVQLIQDMIVPEMLILFGSYARGDWVEELAEDGVHFKYQSDFDLLVVMKNEYEATKVERNRALRDRFHHELKTPVGLIAEDIQFVNRRIRKGQFFYTDILHEGIMLSDSGQFTLDAPRELHANERRKLAEEDFKYWFEQAEVFYEDFQYNFQKGKQDKKYLGIAAFLLHQATERLYGAVLLVYTRYKPSSHDLEKLGQRVASVEPQFLSIFPRGSESDIRTFELLRHAYVDARYKPSYTISLSELTWLAERVQALKAQTEKLCRDKIASFI